MKITVSESRKADSKKVTVDYPLGETLQDNVKSHGEKVVNDLFLARAKVKIQDVVRPMLKAGKDQKAIQDEVSKLKLDEKRVQKKSAKDKALDIWNKMSDEEKAEFKKSLGK